MARRSIWRGLWYDAGTPVVVPYEDLMESGGGSSPLPANRVLGMSADRVLRKYYIWFSSVQICGNI